MGFFDDLVLPEEPAAESAVLARLRPPREDDGRYAPPVDHFAPVRVQQLEVVGAGPETRILLTGWSVWPRSVTVHLTIFRKTRRQDAGASRQSGLRVGLLLSDGRRVTTVDGTFVRRINYTGPQGEPIEAQTDQAVGLIPLDPGSMYSRRSRFTTDVDLYLAELPPPGEAQLVVEWPDEEVAEARAAIDVAALRAASRRVLEVWPGLEPPDPQARQGVVTSMQLSGAARFLAPPLTREQRETLRREEEAQQRYVPRADWQQMGYRDWADTALIRARLEGGAPAGTLGGSPGATPLHRVAEHGAAEAVTALLAYGVDVDARDNDGHTPLWYAAGSMDEATVRTLIDAGADVWRPQSGPWSPGRLLLTTSLAALVQDLPGATELLPEEVAEQQAADTLIAAFGDEPLWTEGLGVCFVRGLSEDELIRRIGADPARCPTADLDDAPFDEEDYEESLRFVGVRSVAGAPGGCVITQDGHAPIGGALLEAISAGTTACGVYFSPKGGTFRTVARDGEVVTSDEIGSAPLASDPAAYWTFRFWQRRRTFPYGADILAYCCATAGLGIGDGRDAVARGGPRRWVPLPARLQN
ncbi:Ankyrin repeat-containing protein [Streptomyces sp. DvalAA-14]|uniref:ankyrin repeat domain-containing protein n=1 Tax=unclassified Streptomyces TaxID=2593676 RepID=UPI00081AFC9F|nr:MULTISPECIES: ankyrin repeat domain-containing protein [unclassified Streptomyces]MYS22471.1 ankyrin repeat domain-containing protein [Streptomyces sp. SID4948]SCE16918.1 Ankyrin repeat-containing protein [Streptomyces sp. DvalAA-14]